MRVLRLPSFAKINLALQILGKRADGYHELKTVFQSVELHDELEFRFARDKRFHLVLDIDESSIPTDCTNLIYKACHAFHERHPLGHRIEVKIRKRIPVQSGLGGGSSNAAATLIALSHLYNWPIVFDQLADLASKLGADVPYFLHGGTAIATARGDRIASVLTQLPQCPVLVVPSSVRCSTAEIYHAFDAGGLLTATSNSINIQLDSESLKDLISRIGNDLEQVVFTLYPELGSTKQRLLQYGAVAAALTGSGSAVFGLFSDSEKLGEAARHFPGSIQTRFITRQEYRSRLRLK